jgi:hypothetical protein
MTRDGFYVSFEQIEIVEVSHPLPECAGLFATQLMLDLGSDSSADDVVLCIIMCGGFSVRPLHLDGSKSHVSEIQAMSIKWCNMRKEYDFSKARKNPYAAQLKKQITIRLAEGSIV